MTSSPQIDLSSLCDQVIQDMLKEKQANPEIIVSYSFLEYFNQSEIMNLISSVYDYSKILTRINTAYLSLKQEGRLSQAKQYSDSQSNLLQEAGKKVAQNYGKVLFRYKYLVPSLEDQNFFETIIYFTVRVVKSCFDAMQFKLLDEELHRLFRSTAFNVAQRKNNDAEKSQKFNKLKFNLKKDADSVINGIIVRNWANRESVKNKSVDCIKRPAFSKISPYRAIGTRSPLISMLLPSPTDKIREFEERRRRTITKSQRLPQLFR